MQVSKIICAMCTLVLVNLCLYAYFVLVYRIVYWIIPNCMFKNLVRTTPGLNAGSATAYGLMFVCEKCHFTTLDKPMTKCLFHVTVLPLPLVC